MEVEGKDASTERMPMVLVVNCGRRRNGGGNSGWHDCPGRRLACRLGPVCRIGRNGGGSRQLHVLIKKAALSEP